MNNIHKTASRRLFAVRVLRPFLTRKDLASVYKGLVLSIIEYCSPLLVGMSITNRNVLNKLQRRAHNIVCDDKCSCDIFEDLTCRRNRATVEFLAKICRLKDHPLHFLCPHRSCRSGKFTMPYCKTVRRRNSFFPSAIMLANNIHVD